MQPGAPGPFGALLKALREAAGFTQEELATLAGLSVHGVSALERGERRRPHVETIRALAAALDLSPPVRDALVASARAPAHEMSVGEPAGMALPLAPTPIIGREDDIGILAGWLADPAARFITLVGPGGVGKTRLALEIARAIADAGPTRVVFVSLAALRDPALVASAIAEALGMADVTAVELPGRARAAVGDRPTLLVLDNFEQVLAATPLVVALLSSVPPLRLLITSRAALRARGEREYAVGPLRLEADPASKPPTTVARAPAVQLFVERVQGVQPDFRLTAANASLVTAICRRLDALPLALELAAPWLKVLTVEKLLELLSRDVLFSTVGQRDLPERQQTMNATVAWSCHLLGPTEQRAFRRLGALPGRFSVEAAAAVLAGREGPPGRGADALRLVAALIDKSLLLRAEASVATRPSYVMFETVRAYAALELAAAGEREDALEGLARHCSTEAALAKEGLVGPAQVEWLDRVRDDLESHRAVLTWLIERGRSAEAADIAWGLKYFWLIRGHAAEGLQWYQRILQLPSVAPAAELRALAGAAVLWYTLGDLEHARGAVTRVMTLADGDADREVVAQAEYLSGHVEHAVGNLETARERFARSLEAFRALASASGTGNALSAMAVIALATGDPKLAGRLLDEATSALRHAGPWFLTWALYARAILAVRCERPNEAITLVRASLTRIKALHDKFAFVYALVPLAAAAVLKGDHAWAARILGTRDALTDHTGVTFVDKSMSDLQEQAEREARAHLGPERWALAYADGRTASVDSLIKDIDRAVKGRTRT